MPAAPAAPPRVLLVLGGQEFFAERAIRAALAHWRAAGAEVHEVSGSSEGVLSDLFAAASPDLFGSTPAVVLREAEALDDATAARVVELIEADSTPWVLHHAGGRGSTKARDRLQKAAGQVVKAEALKGRGVSDFVRDEFRAQRKTADEATIALLVAAVGADPRGLASAVAQLASDIPDKHISEAAAADYYRGHVEIKGYEIADAVAARDTARALENLRFALREGGTRAGLMTITSLSTTLTRLAAAKTARPGSGAAADVAAALRIPEWMARTAVAQARGWTSTEIARAVSELAELSVLMKGGFTDEGALSDEQKAYVLERAVVEMTTARSDAG